MNKNEYRQLSCRSIGNECDFMIRAGTEEEVRHLANVHLCEAHNICALTSELKDRITESLENMRCEERVCALSS